MKNVIVKINEKRGESMEFVRRKDLPKEEQAYINNILGYEEVSDMSRLIGSTKEKIYRILIRSGHPDSDLNRDTVDFIIYKDYIIRLRFRYIRGGRIDYSEILVPERFKNEEVRILQIIKQTQQLLGSGRGENPDETVLEYVNGIPIQYYEEGITAADLLGGIEGV